MNEYLGDDLQEDLPDRRQYEFYDDLDVSLLLCFELA